MSKDLDKELAIYEYKTMVVEAWTYQKMTQDEQKRLMDVFDWADEAGIIVGSYNARWHILQGLFHSFIQGLGGTEILDKRYGEENGQTRN